MKLNIKTLAACLLASSALVSCNNEFEDGAVVDEAVLLERRLITERAQNRPLAFKGKLLGHYKHALPARSVLPLYFFKNLICFTGRGAPENKFKHIFHPVIF